MRERADAVCAGTGRVGIASTDIKPPDIATVTFGRAQTLQNVRIFLLVGGFGAILVSLAIPYGSPAKATTAGWLAWR